MKPQFLRLADEEDQESVTGFLKLFCNCEILVATGAVCISTTAIALLEPCLPIWLMNTIHPEVSFEQTIFEIKETHSNFQLQKWQLGIVFLPDSLGYLIGANFFAVPSLKFGRYKTAMISLLLTAFGCMSIPFARAIWQLSIPHFLLGLGIGITDSAMMPLLAILVEKEGGERASAIYGSVYAIAQTAVSLAYGLGPLLGGVFSETFGFPTVMAAVGTVNLCYIPLLYLLSKKSYVSDRAEHVISLFFPHSSFNTWLWKGVFL